MQVLLALLLLFLSGAQALDTNTFLLTVEIAATTPFIGFPVPYEKQTFTATIPPGTSYEIPATFGPLQHLNRGQGHGCFWGTFAYAVPNVHKLSCAQGADNLIHASIYQGDGRGPYFSRMSIKQINLHGGDCFSQGLCSNDIPNACPLWGYGILHNTPNNCIPKTVGAGDLTASFVARTDFISLQGFHSWQKQDQFRDANFGISITCARQLSCLNGGHPAGLKCSCPADFFGDACEIPCNHVGGIFDEATHHCICRPNYYGTTCDKHCECHDDAVCNMGAHGDGSCHCDNSRLYFGSDPNHCIFCNTSASGGGGQVDNNTCVCADGFYGPGCSQACSCPAHTYCHSGRQGDGSCHCDTSVHYYGTDPTTCTFCSPEGGIWDDYSIPNMCACKKRYSGISCETYDPPPIRNVVRVMSDLHIGSPWFQNRANQQALLDFLHSMALDTSESNVRELVLGGDIIEYWMTRIHDAPLTPLEICKARNLWSTDIFAYVEAIKAIAEVGVKVSILTGNHDLQQDAWLVRQVFGPNVIFVGDSWVSNGVRFEHGHNFDLFNARDPGAGPTFILPPFGYYVSRWVATSGWTPNHRSPFSVARLLADFMVKHFPRESMEFLEDHPFYWKKVLQGILAEVSMHDYDSINRVTVNDGPNGFPSMHEIVYRYSRLLRRWLKEGGKGRDYLFQMMHTARTNNQDYWAAQKQEKVVIFGHTHEPLMKYIPRCWWCASEPVLLVNSGSWVDSSTLNYVDLVYDYLSPAPSQVYLRSYRRVREVTSSSDMYGPDIDRLLARVKVILRKDGTGRYTSFDDMPIGAVPCNGTISQDVSFDQQEQNNLVTLAILNRALFNSTDFYSRATLSSDSSLQPGQRHLHWISFCGHNWATTSGKLFYDAHTKILQYISPDGSDPLLQLAEWWSTSRNNTLPAPSCRAEDQQGRTICRFSRHGFEAEATTMNEREVPEGWTCNPHYYNSSDGCHCMCGVIDPDCSSPEQPLMNCDAHPIVDNDLNPIAWCDAALAVCQYQKTPPPEWRCAANTYNALDGCDCECGAFDPDCAIANQTIRNCAFPSGGGQVYCTLNATCVQETVIPGWHCSADEYNGSNGCDCNCGLYDPDCETSKWVLNCHCGDTELAACSKEGNCLCKKEPPAVLDYNESDDSFPQVLFFSLLGGGGGLFLVVVAVVVILYISALFRRRHRKRQRDSSESLPLNN